MDAERFLIVLPTYEERDNLPRVVEQIEAVLPALPFAGDVLVVDDSSPDGTGDLADELAAASRGCTCCTGRASRASAARTSPGSAGRWSATTRTSWRWTATSRIRPGALPAMLDASRRRRPGARLALRRRRRRRGLAGSSRRAISRGGCLYARRCWACRLHDLTGRLQVLPPAGAGEPRPDDVHAGGYAFQIELTYRALRIGCARRSRCRSSSPTAALGGSKMSRDIVVEAVWQVP